MAPLKLYVGTAVWIPNEWSKRTNPERYHAQGDVLIVAASKRAAEELLIQTGAAEVTAKSVVRATRLAGRDILPSDARLLVDAEVVLLDEAGAYIYRHAVDGQKVARIDVDGMPIVAIFRLVERIEDGRRTYRLRVEPFTEVTA